MDMNIGRAVRSRKVDMQYYRTVDYSGFIERLFAACVDWAVTTGSGYLFYTKFGIKAAIIFVLVFDFTMRVLFTYFKGGTPGKLLFGVRVVSRCSRRLSIWQVIDREIFKLISMITFGIGYISIIFSKRKLAWHDMISCTAVVSGGRDEYKYASDIYAVRPQKWDKWLYTGVELLIIASLFLLINMGSLYVLHEKGMIGYAQKGVCTSSDFIYKLPEGNEGYDTNKKIVQIGDIEGDGKLEVLREGVKDDKPFIYKTSFIGSQFLDSDVGVGFDKPIIQYRLLDMDGDGKDELSVLLEDKIVKLYKFSGGAEEIGSFGPIEYNNISSVACGKPMGKDAAELYIMGEGKKLTVLSYNEHKIEGRNVELIAENDLKALDAGTLDGPYYIAAVDNQDRLVLFSYDGELFGTGSTMNMPVKNCGGMSMNDIDSDGKSEFVVWSPPYEGMKNPIIGAFTISGGNVKLTWDGGRKGFILEDAGDTDNDGEANIYMTERSISSREVSYTIYTYESSKLLQRLQYILRTLGIESRI